VWPVSSMRVVLGGGWVGWFGALVFMDAWSKNVSQINLRSVG